MSGSSSNWPLREFPVSAIAKTGHLVAMMSVFYENLLAEQEILGADFRKVLTKNLWELYES